MESKTDQDPRRCGAGILEGGRCYSNLHISTGTGEGPAPWSRLHLPRMMRGNWPIGEERSNIPGRGNSRCKDEMSLAETGKGEEACESGAERANGRRERVRSGR